MLISSYSIGSTLPKILAGHCKSCHPFTIETSKCCYQAWLLKNSLFAPNGQIWGDRKCLPNPRRSIVGLPDAILFLRISRVGVFQQPQAITLIDPDCECNRDISIVTRTLPQPPSRPGSLRGPMVVLG